MWNIPNLLTLLRIVLIPVFVAVFYLQVGWSNIACALDDLMLPYTIDLSVFDTLNHAELEEHIERVGVLFYDRKKQGQRFCCRRLPLNPFALKSSVGRDDVIFSPVSS